MYEYPKKLVDYLAEAQSEGSEIFTTQSDDVACWIVKPAGLEDWYVLITWYEGSSDFDIVNLTGKALKRLKLCFIEDNGK